MFKKDLLSDSLKEKTIITIITRFHLNVFQVHFLKNVLLIMYVSLPLGP